VIVSAVRTTARGDYGLITSKGRLIRGNALDLPTVPVTANAPNLQGGAHVSELISVAESGERILALSRLGDDAATIALGTRQGVVKRVNPELLNKDVWDIIRLEDGDEVVGAAELTDENVELTFISDDAQLLHFPASVVRPQGRSGGGIAGIKLGAGRSVSYFGAVPDGDAIVITVAGSGDALPGTDAGTIKVTPFAEYPGKGRATGGVRCHRFLKGEGALLFAWAGPVPAIAAADSGAPIDLPAADGRRDGSGTPAAQPITAAGTRTLG
jgi:DNA gyrase subunit A